MQNRHPLLLKTAGPALALLLVGASCGSTDDASTSSEAKADTETATAAEVDDAGTDGTTETDTETDNAGDTSGSGSTNTLAGVEVAQWGDNVTITIGDGSFQFVSNGLPNHELPDQFLVPNDGNMPPFDGDEISDEFHIENTDDLIVESPLDVEITLDPVYSDEVTLTDLSTIGVMISGAPLFNDYEDQSRQYVALDDNLSLDGAYFIDACNGHPLASGSSYHYHGVPYCITDQIDEAGEHSTIVGVLLDGFPIYGPQDVDGVILTNTDLDECSGHFGPTPEFPDGIYHYHLTEDANPYSIDCFHGEIDYAANNRQGPPPGAEGDDAGGPPPGDDEAAGGQGRPEGPGGQGGPDLTEAAAALGVTVEELAGAIGQPPFDLETAAEVLGVTAEELEAVLPAPPEGGALAGG